MARQKKEEGEGRGARSSVWPALVLRHRGRPVDVAWYVVVARAKIGGGDSDVSSGGAILVGRRRSLQGE